MLPPFEKLIGEIRDSDGSAALPDQELDALAFFLDPVRSLDEVDDEHLGDWIQEAGGLAAASELRSIGIAHASPENLPSLVDEEAAAVSFGPLQDAEHVSTQDAAAVQARWLAALQAAADQSLAGVARDQLPGDNRSLANELVAVCVGQVPHPSRKILWLAVAEAVRVGLKNIAAREVDGQQAAVGVETVVGTLTTVAEVTRNPTSYLRLEDAWNRLLKSQDANSVEAYALHRFAGRTPSEVAELLELDTLNEPGLLEYLEKLIDDDWMSLVMA